MHDDRRFHTVQGGMQRRADEVTGEEYVAISLWGRNADGHVVGQRILIPAHRLEQRYGRTLTWAVRDLECYGVL